MTWTEAGVLESRRQVGLIVTCLQPKTNMMAPWPKLKSGGGGMWWWGGVLDSVAGERVNTRLPGDRHSCQISVNSGQGLIK